MIRQRPKYFSLLGGFVLSAPVIAVVVESITQGHFFEIAWSLGAKTALANSLILMVCTSLFTVLLSLPLAWLLHATDIPLKRVLHILFVIPLALPSYVGGYLVIATFAPGGMCPLFDPYSLWGAVGAISFCFPLAYLSIRSSFSNVDMRQWNAARSLGCSGWQAFYRVVWPQTKGGVVSGGLWVGLYALGDFGAVSLTRYKSLSFLIYLRYKSLFEKNEAAVYAVMLLVVSALIYGISLKIGLKNNIQSRSHLARWSPIKLGRYKWCAGLYCIFIILFWVVAPLVVLLSWWNRGMAMNIEFSMPWSDIARSMILAFGGAFLICLFCMMMVSEKYGRAWTGHRPPKTLQLLAFLGYALPGIVIGLACATGIIRWLPMLYQSTTILVLGLFIRFSPLAIETLSLTLYNQSDTSYWASRSLGLNRWQAFFKVVFPAVKGSVMVSFLALFVAILKELPVTMLLSPPGFSTLSMKIWSLTEDAFFAETAPVALTMVFLAIVVLCLQLKIQTRGQAAGSC